MLQICAYATFSATTVQKFPVCACVLLFKRVDILSLRIFSVLIVRVDKIPGLKPTFVLTKSKNFKRFAVLPGIDISF